jgi:lipoprotein signal peptidase
MTQRSYRGLLWTLALLGASLDQASKYGVFHWLYNGGAGNRHQVVPGAFELTADFLHDPNGVVLGPRVNQGALFGIFGDHKERANAVFATVSVLAAAAIVWWSTRKATAGDGFLCAALGLILAGTLGNLYDRVVFGGVRDLLHFYWFEWPVFNVADCCLVVGAFLLLAQAFWARHDAPAPQPAEPAVQPQVAEVP